MYLYFNRYAKEALQMFIAGNSSSFQIFFPSLSLDDRSLHLLIFVMAPFLFFKNSFFLIKFALCDHDNMGRHEFKTKQNKQNGLQK